MAQLNTKIVLRNDIYTAWESSNPVLLKGEIGVEYNPAAPTAEGQLDYQVRIKIGDGVNKWNDLPYFGGDSTVIEEITATIEDITKDITEISNLLGNNETEGTVIYRIGHLEERVEALEDELVNKANSADVYTKEETDNAIASAVANAEHLKRVIISQEVLNEYLAEPSKAEKNVIYMVKTETLVKDSYQEFMRFDSESGAVSFEQIGDTSVNLADYATTEYVDKEIETVEGAIALKADQSALNAANEEIAKKADSETVNSALEAKADKTQVAIDIANAIAPLAVKTEVEEALATKANSDDVYSKDDVYNKTEIDGALGLKADKSYVDEKLATKADKATTLAGYGITDAYTKSETYTQSEVNALLDQITGGDTSETAASVKRQLDTYISTNDARVAGAEERIKALEDAGADDNVIENIKIAGEDAALEVTDKTVTLPAATEEKLGLAKLSSEVGVDANGALEVKSLNANKLTQSTGEFLILYGGSASDNLPPVAES